jgi:hypothetical protein
MEYFNLVTKTADFSDALMIWQSGELIKDALAFIIFIEISTYPHEFFQGKE